MRPVTKTMLVEGTMVMGKPPPEKAGSDYYGIKCGGCGQDIGVLDMKDHQFLKFSGDGVWRVTCDICGHTTDCPASEIKRFRAQMPH